MAEAKAQINPRISQRLMDKINALRQERQVGVSEIVETALQQYFGELQEVPEDKLDVLLKQNSQLLHGMTTILDALGKHQMNNDDTVPAQRDVAPGADWTEDGRVVVSESPRKRRWW